MAPLGGPGTVLEEELQVLKEEVLALEEALVLEGEVLALEEG